MGRRPLPTLTRELRGTARADRANAAEPKPPSLEVGAKAPAWLKGVRRRRAWADLSELLRGQNVLTVMDAGALAMLVDAYGDYLEASELVAGAACGRCGLPLSSSERCPAIDLEDGLAELIEGAHSPGRRYYTTRTKEGSLMIRPHPAMAVRQDAWKRVVAMLDRFGMSPSARSRVMKTESAEADPFEDFLRGPGRN